MKPKIEIYQSTGRGWHWRMIHNSHGIPGLTMLLAHSVSTYCEYHNTLYAIRRVILTLRDPRLERYFNKGTPKKDRICPYFELAEWLGYWSWILYGKAGHRAAHSGDNVTTRKTCEDSMDFFTENFHTTSIAHIIKDQG